MSTIDVEQPVVTLINVFTVEPSDQQRLVDLLVRATEETMNKRPGFVSANIHKSIDGRHVANYAQWRSVEDYEAMLENPDARVHMSAAMSFATYRSFLYRVSFSDSKEAA